jgi:exosortase E/protease (VPEID-CTERM system)
MPLLTTPAPPQNRTHGRSASHASLGLLPRLLALTFLFAAELLLLSIWLDNSALVAQGGIIGLVGQGGAWAVRGVVGFGAILVTFAYLTKRTALAEISLRVEQAPIGRGLLVSHLLAMAAFSALSWALYGSHLAAVPAGISVALWLITGLAGIAFAALALAPLRVWSQLLRQTGSLSAFALVFVVAACVAGNYIRLLWGPTTNLTFFLTRAFLHPFVSGIVSDPATKLLGTEKFQVIIAPECSGFEGVGLILAFSACWLWLFRRECRFPHALLLIPAGVVTIFLLNAVRITALILIGNAGAPQVALGGFHSQAGWIAFNAVALGFSIAATRVPWLTRREHATPATTAASFANPSTPYLLPFLTILAVGMLTTAASSNFEWLYPLRFLAAAGVLWTMRKHYSSLNLKLTWFGPSIGVLVFALWIAFDSLQKTGANDAMPLSLTNSSAPVRIGWIAFRVLAAVVTVPIAEELAFRGFLLRRFVSADFEALPLSTFTWIGLGISSLAFGLLHGHLWFVGTLTGVLYAWAMLRHGRIGEAVIAHATTNALLACYVLAFHKWHLW